MMAASEALTGEPGLGAFDLRRVVMENLQGFCAECDRFIQRQYREIIRGNPSKEQRETHRRALKWALRTAKLLECVPSDPDSPSPAMVALLRAKVWQLEESWKAIYEPMPEEQANKLLAEIFPDESGT
jgi:hypothetical protein